MTPPFEYTINSAAVAAAMTTAMNSNQNSVNKLLGYHSAPVGHAAHGPPTSSLGNTSLPQQQQLPLQQHQQLRHHRVLQSEQPQELQGKQTVAFHRTVEDEQVDEQVLDNMPVSPRPLDVLLGRGKSNLNHPGNKYFQGTNHCIACLSYLFPFLPIGFSFLFFCSFAEIISLNRDRYFCNATTMEEKRSIVCNIVAFMQQTGRSFLKEKKHADHTSFWVKLSEDATRHKVAHALQYRQRRVALVKSTPTNSVGDTFSNKIKKPKKEKEVDHYHRELSIPSNAAAAAAGMQQQQLHQHVRLVRQRRSLPFSGKTHGNNNLPLPPPHHHHHVAIHHHHQTMPFDCHPEPLQKKPESEELLQLLLFLRENPRPSVNTAAI